MGAAVYPTEDNPAARARHAKSEGARRRDSAKGVLISTLWLSDAVPDSCARIGVNVNRMVGVRVRDGSPLFALCRTWVCDAGKAEERRQRPKKRSGRRRESGPERWARWQRLLEEGVYGSKAELARGEGVSRAAVTMGLRKLTGEDA